MRRDLLEARLKLHVQVAVELRVVEDIVAVGRLLAVIFCRLVVDAESEHGRIGFKKDVLDRFISAHAQSSCSFIPVNHLLVVLGHERNLNRLTPDIATARLLVVSTGVLSAVASHSVLITWRRPDVKVDILVECLEVPVPVGVDAFAGDDFISVGGLLGRVLVELARLVALGRNQLPVDFMAAFLQVFHEGGHAELTFDRAVSKQESLLVVGVVLVVDLLWVQACLHLHAVPHHVLLVAETEFLIAN